MAKEKAKETKAVVEKAVVAEPSVVTLGHPDPSAVLFYTTDGTYPVPNKAARYSKPFTVNPQTVVKAVAVVNEDVSPVMTRQY